MPEQPEQTNFDFDQPSVEVFPPEDPQEDILPTLGPSGGKRTVERKINDRKKNANRNRSREGE